MTTSRLSLYNAALSHCGQRGLASLNETGEPRYLLDDVWTRGGVRYCLEQGLWNFACRTQMLDYSASITPQFGYRRAFQMPSDVVRIKNVGQDEYFLNPLLRYQYETGYIYANLDIIYVRYVSDDANFGSSFASWPEAFREYVEAYFASKIIRNLTSDEVKTDALLHPKTGILVMALKRAQSIDASAEPTQFPPEGSWNRARRGYRGSRRGPFGDGGTSGSLIG